MQREAAQEPVHAEPPPPAHTLLQGEHLRRRPLLHVQAEVLEVERQERAKLGIVERLTARKPADR